MARTAWFHSWHLVKWHLSSAAGRWEKLRKQDQRHGSPVRIDNQSIIYGRLDVWVVRLSPNECKLWRLSLRWISDGSGWHCFITILRSRLSIFFWFLCCSFPELGNIAADTLLRSVRSFIRFSSFISPSTVAVSSSNRWISQLHRDNYNSLDLSRAFQ